MRPRSTVWRRLSFAALCSYAVLGASACGATPANRHGAAPASRPAQAGPQAAAPAGSSCAQAVAATLGEVAKRIYREASNGGDVEQAVHRLQSSSALASAVAAGNRAAATSVLRSLLLGQIARVEVLRGGRVLASAGSGPAIAPVEGEVPGTAGRFVLSVQPDRTYLQVAHQVTGAEVLLLSGSHATGTVSLPAGVAVPASGPFSIGSQRYQVTSLTGSAYPSGSLRIALLVPSSQLSCPAEAAQTRTAVLGRVGERIYEEELDSPTVRATVRAMESDAAFKDAVATRDPTAVRRAIVGFFEAHIHVVRVRVTVGGKLLYDLGGPHVLAPVEGTLRQDGRVIGQFLMAIQDDAGYLKLARLFTGAQVLMRTAAGQVEGTLQPGPASVPDRGSVSYGGRTYQAYSFAATAFPSGRLQISLLF